MRTQCVRIWKRFVKLPHDLQIANGISFAKLRRQSLRKHRQQAFPIFGAFSFTGEENLLSYFPIQHDHRGIDGAGNRLSRRENALANIAVNGMRFLFWQRVTLLLFCVVHGSPPLFRIKRIFVLCIENLFWFARKSMKPLFFLLLHQKFIEVGNIFFVLNHAVFFNLQIVVVGLIMFSVVGSY